MEADLEGHINPDASASIKQDHGDGCYGDGDEDGVMNQRKPKKVVEPPGLLAPTILKYKSLPKKLIKASRE